MGNIQSNPEKVSLEDFKDQVFGTTVFLLSKVINSHLEFRSKDECGSEHLPLPKIDSDNIYEIALSYYNYAENKDTEKDLDDQIETYVNTNILNSKENVTRFYKVLIERLLCKNHGASDAVQPSVPVKPSEVKPRTATPSTNHPQPNTYQQRQQQQQPEQLESPAKAGLPAIAEPQSRLQPQQKQQLSRQQKAKESLQNYSQRGGQKTQKTQKTQKSEKPEKPEKQQKPTLEKQLEQSLTNTPVPEKKIQYRAVSPEYQVNYPKATDVGSSLKSAMISSPKPQYKSSKFDGCVLSDTESLVKKPTMQVLDNDENQEDDEYNYDPEQLEAQHEQNYHSDQEQKQEEPVSPEHVSEPASEQVSEQAEPASDPVPEQVSDQVPEQVTDPVPEQVSEPDEPQQSQQSQQFQQSRQSKPEDNVVNSKPQVSYEEEYDGDELEYDEYDTLPDV